MTSNKKEQILKKELICKGKIIGIENVKIDLGNKKIANWERAVFLNSKNGKGEGVIILAIDKHKEILLIKKYMGAQNKRMITLPMGALKDKSSKLNSAKEELAEETGYSAKKWFYIMPLNGLPGYISAQSYFFIAYDIYKLKKPPKGDEVEYLKVYKIPLKRAVQLIKQGKIVDARTCACILYVDKFFNF